MSGISSLIELFLNAQVGANPTLCPNSIPTVTPMTTPLGYICDNCGGSAFSSIAAAFGTIGYWSQAAWLHQIYDYGLGKFVMLAYIFSVISGIVGFVMGGSPRQYLWLFIGPALFYWLTEYRTAVSGVNWMVGGTNRDQREVWRMAETGLLNEDYIQRFGFTVTSALPPSFTGSGALTTGESVPCNQTDGACISNFFGYFDQVISDTVQYLIGFIGAGRKMYGTGSTGTNIIRDTPGGGTTIYHADLMKDMRWSFFASISEARINSPDLRRSFATFMSSECGDQFLSAVQQDKLQAVKSRQESPLTSNVLDGDYLNTVINLPFIGPFPVSIPLEIRLWSRLTAVVPTPKELKEIITHRFRNFTETNKMGEESNALYFADLLTNPVTTTGLRFTDSVPAPKTETYSKVPALTEIVTCKTFLTILMQALRWEAAHIAYQILTDGPDDMFPIDYAASMLYGMDIKYPGSFGGFPGGGAPGTQLKKNHIPLFVESLVLSKIFANELQVSPAVASQTESQYSAPVANKNVQDIKQFQRVNNQFSKFGELYTWAEMVPYFQGQLLYYLAIAYPFAAMFVVIPGMFKGFLQWCQFWIWVKLWDLGFAMVTVLERSVWSITGGGSKNGDFNTLILQIAQVNGANGTNICEAKPSLGGMGLDSSVTLPTVAVDPFYSLVSTTTPASHANGILNMQCLIDRLLADSGNIGLNMANTYYIYIMSALYMSVPVICGTLVLGAKSGMASMLGSTMGGIASPAGGAASNAATGNYSKALGSNQATFGQEQFAKSLRSGAAAGFAKQALDAQNVSTAEQMSAGFVGTRSQALGGLSSVMGSDMNAMYSNLQSAMQGGQMMLAGMDIGGQSIAKAIGSGDKSAAGLNDGSSVSRGPGMPGMFGQGMASSATAGATASGTSGDGARDGGRGLGAGLGTAAKLLNNYGAMNNMAAMREMATTTLAAMAQLSAAQQGLAVASTGHQSASSLAGLRGQRLNEVADFAGREGQWTAQDNVAQSGMASEVAAITGSTGMVASGQKPQSASAMAYLGRMEGGNVGAGGRFSAFGGHGSMASARAANSGGSLDRHRSAGMADLKSNYGSDFVSQGAKGGAIDPNKSVRDAAYDTSLAQTWKGLTPLVKGFQDGLVGRGMDPIMGALGGAIGQQASAAGQSAIDYGNQLKAAGNNVEGNASIALGQAMRSMGQAGVQGQHYSEGGNIYTGMQPGARSVAKDSGQAGSELAKSQKLERGGS